MKNLKINYTVGGVLWVNCPGGCETPLVIFHSRFKDHVPYCNNCRKEYKLNLTEIERKDENAK